MVTSLVDARKQRQATIATNTPHVNKVLPEAEVFIINCIDKLFPASTSIELLVENWAFKGVDGATEINLRYIRNNHYDLYIGLLDKVVGYYKSCNWIAKYEDHAKTDRHGKILAHIWVQDPDDPLILIEGKEPEKATMRSEATKTGWSLVGWLERLSKSLT